MPPDTKIGARRIFVAEDHAFFRSGLTTWIDQQPDLACCGEAETSVAARQAIGVLKPDLVILDLNLKGEDGLELIKQLVAEYPSLLVLAVSQGDEKIFAERALRAGAKGYLMKEEAAGDVLVAIRRLLNGEIHLSAYMATRLLQNYLRSPREGEIAELGSLTDRELQVFMMIGAELGPSEIAAKLRLSVKTVETYREKIKAKLRLRGGSALNDAAIRWVRRVQLS